MYSLLKRLASYFFSPVSADKRRGWIDYARGFVIIYVVYRHTMSGLISSGLPITNAIYLVQEASMPIFFIVSGIFIHSSLVKRGFQRFVKFKFEGLIYPYLIWVTIHLTIQILFSTWINSDKTLKFYGYIFVLPRSLDQFWYLYTLFMVMSLFAFINIYLIKFRPIPNIITAIILYVLSYFLTSNWFALNDSLFYYIFVTFGFLISDWLLPVKSKFFTDWRIPVFLLPVFVFLHYLWHSLFPGVVRLNELDFLGFSLFVPITILTALYIFILSHKLDSWGVLPILRYIGSKSLYIYIMHLIFTGTLRFFLLKYFDLSVVSMFVLVLSGGVFIPIITYHIIRMLKMDFLFEPPKIIAAPELFSDDKR